MSMQSGAEKRVELKVFFRTEGRILREDKSSVSDV